MVEWPNLQNRYAVFGRLSSQGSNFTKLLCIRNKQLISIKIRQMPILALNFMFLGKRQKILIQNGNMIRTTISLCISATYAPHDENSCVEKKCQLYEVTLSLNWKMSSFWRHSFLPWIIGEGQGSLYTPWTLYNISPYVYYIP